MVPPLLTNYSEINLQLFNLQLFNLQDSSDAILIHSFSGFYEIDFSALIK